MIPFDRIVLLGFGGPESRDEIRPFLDRILQGRNVPRERYESVVQHYELIGGKSPFNELTRRQAQALRAELRARAHGVAVDVAYLYAEPFARDLAARLSHDEARRTLCIVLASFQSAASWDRYHIIQGARYAPVFGEEPLFVQAYADRVRDALSNFGDGHLSEVALIFTAHSIPQAMADASPYAAQFERTAERVAHAVEAPHRFVAYQSRSGSPAEPWLGPDVREVIEDLPARGIRKAILAPIGFVCDHVEVLYDLDVDAASVARSAGITVSRARALNDHPLFIRMLADVVERCAESPS